MRDIFSQDTIAAIATPIGRGAIGIIRISGKDALAILKRVFKKKTDVFADRKMTLGFVVDQKGRPIDQALAVYMKAPRTFTGEDVVEIHSHGGPLVLKKILRRVLDSGARLAEPGEFTLRAFLNGKIDLLQAQAINDIINASSESQLKLALANLEGKLSKKIRELQDRLLSVRAEMEARIDFPEEEDVSDLETDVLLKEISDVKKEITKLLETFEEGKFLKEGIKIAIVGKPNVGKSSLLNALLRQDRAIVSSIPGTTRDVIEESMSIKGIPVRIVDTAGIRDTSDEVERKGVERSLKKLKEADILLVVFDASESLSEEDRQILELVSPVSQRVIVVLNKSDLKTHLSCRDFKLPCVKVSAKTEEGIENLKELIFNTLMLSEEHDFSEPMITEEWQRQALLEAKEALDRAEISMHQSLELSSEDVKEAMEALGKIVGQFTTEDILDVIFGRFCIGK